MYEYKEITLDMSVKEIMELDLDRIEYWSGEEYGFVKVNEEALRIIAGLKKGLEYRYRLKPKESMKITLRLLEDIVAGSYLSPYNGEKIKYLEDKYGRKIELIE